MKKMVVEKFLRGNSHPRNSYQSGGNFLGWGFAYTEENICEELSSVHALTLIFIRKTLFLQTHNIRV